MAGGCSSFIPIHSNSIHQKRQIQNSIGRASYGRAGKYHGTGRNGKDSLKKKMGGGYMGVKTIDYMAGSFIAYHHSLDLEGLFI